MLWGACFAWFDANSNDWIVAQRVHVYSGVAAGKGTFVSPSLAAPTATAVSSHRQGPHQHTRSVLGGCSSLSAELCSLLKPASGSFSTFLGV